jgi:hypothetical protein
MILGIKKAACQPPYSQIKTHTNHGQISNFVLYYKIAQFQVLSSPQPKKGEYL